MEINTDKDHSPTSDANSSLIDTPHENSLSYIHNLSDDLLREIFKLYIHGSTGLEENYTLPQDILSTVCKEWRSLILNSPLLWTTIQLPLQPRYNVATYFERSAPALVDVSYDRSHFHWIDDLYDAPSQVLDAISSNISRIRSLKIRTWAEKEATSILCAWKGKQATQLRTLEIISPYIPSDSNLFFGLTSFSDMSNLRSLIVEKFLFQGFYPLPNLIFLRVDKFNQGLEDLRALVDNCRLLETLIIRQFSGSLNGAVPEDSRQKIASSSLRSLSVNIDDSHETGCSCFLPFLSAPNLEYLEIAYVSNHIDAHLESIFYELTRSSNLRTLHIHSDVIWSGSLSILSSLPATTDLHLHSGDLLSTLRIGLPYIFNTTNLKSVTLNLQTQSFYQFFSQPIALPNLRFPFFLRSPPEASDWQEFECQIQELLGSSLAHVMPPSKENGFLGDFLQTQLLNETWEAWGEEDDDDDFEDYQDDFHSDDSNYSIDIHPGDYLDGWP
ncbi:hypothetical protein JR316_0001062 [Psilocybe cubensis]|uniref:Uncharacterized protein n=2 Tax=Psilocybe cubensis TaxID=181762 RepID=A0ACB8HGD8_PSICU|nr:hypothetical protein JR316_0001062 [Psilocybe cubensis]KAH9486996.1 hypothetical protein JR316_0001062 [Psilocybe cubensis]